MSDKTPGDTAKSGSRSYAGDIIRSSLSHYWLPGLTITSISGIIGAIVGSLGIGGPWVVGVSLVVVGVSIAGAFLRMRRSDDIGELYFASVFVLLSIPMFQVLLTRMDMYGFYTLTDLIEGDLANTPIPVLLPLFLPLVVNLFLAFAAGVMFDFLWKWQYSSGKGERRPYTRAAWVALPPLAITYVFVIIFWSPSAWIYVTAVFPMLAGVFTVMALLRDGEISISDSDRKIMLWTAVAVIINLLIFGQVTTLTLLYFDSSLLGIPDHNLFGSWDVDVSEMGYSQDEIRDRVRLGTVCTLIVAIAYFVVVIGGQVLASIQRTRGEDDRNH